MNFVSVEGQVDRNSTNLQYYFKTQSLGYKMSTSRQLYIGYILKTDNSSYDIMTDISRAYLI